MSIPSSAPALFAAFLALAGAAQAYPHYHPHPHRVIIHERPYTRVIVRGSPYWFHDGYYYHHHHGRYFLIGPPLGIVVPILPVGCVRLHFGPTPYYWYAGSYYREAPGGYVVVQKPDTVYVEKALEAGQGSDEKFAEPVSKTVMVKNSNGSQTPVRLEESDGKWKGPRGELYDDFPTDEQLHSAYGF
jgi:hypothetical protein